MKKLRMIVTSVVVLAIVGSAFAFKAKSTAYCVVADSANSNNCTTYLSGKQPGSSGTVYKYAPQPGTWDGTAASCTASGNGLCTAGTIQLTTD